MKGLTELSLSKQSELLTRENFDLFLNIDKMTSIVYFLLKFFNLVRSLLGFLMASKLN